MRPFLGADLDGDLRAGAHVPTSDQLQRDQHRAGSGRLYGRQVDFDVQKEVRATSPDPSVLQRRFNGFRHHVGAAAVEMFRQRVDIDADGRDCPPL